MKGQESVTQSAKSYQEWFRKSEFTRHELALLMAAISPAWEFGQEILHAQADLAVYEEFQQKYKDIPGYWAFWEEFCKADDLIFRSLHTGRLRKCKGSRPGLIPREEAIVFVLECDETFEAFVEAAKLVGSGLDHKAMAPLNDEVVGRDEGTQPSWMMRVQEEAARRWCQYVRSGASPNKHNLKDELAVWCQRNKINSPHGSPPSAAYIYRHVLQKWSSPDCTEATPNQKL
jgi:hypothetical protein